MKDKRAIAVMWSFALLPVLLVAVCMPFLPARVPTNWGLDGSVTYSSASILWLLAGLSPLLAALYQLLPRIDPRKRNYEKFQAWYDAFGIIVPLLLLVCIIITLTESLRPGSVNVSRTVGLLMGGLLLFIGNMLGKVKSNFFMGVRTPWALSDPDVWNKTQRLGGHVFFLTGLVSLPLALFAPEKVFFVLFLAILLGGLALTCFMSWKWFQEKAGA